MDTSKKRGPVKGIRPTASTVRTSLMLEPDMVEWGKEQPGGLSELVRHLLKQERQRQESKEQ